MMQGKAEKGGLRYAIVGAGMAGIMATIKLEQKGETNITLLEKAASIGGTWRDNCYPGLTCDTPSHSYTYSFAPYAEWEANFASGAQIRVYFEKVAADFGVSKHLRLNSEVTSCQFDDAKSVWRLELNGQEQIEADVVIAASGVLHHPNIPRFPRIESFKGKVFHSARWDSSAVVDGTRVGVIGSGSTGVQIVSALADRSAKVVHFQRSPQWIMPGFYFEYSEADRELLRKDPARIDAIRNEPEYWKLIRQFTTALTQLEGPEIAYFEELCLRNLEENVLDPILREKLRPNYRAACKRLVISWEYYDKVQRPTVHVDTGKITVIEPEGVRMQDGTLHELDVLVLATGFQAHSFIRPAKVTGRDGYSLEEFWKDRASAYYAITLPGFPNFFMLNGPTGPVGNFSLIDIAEMEWGYIDQLLDVLRQGKARTVEPTAEAHADYEARRIAAARTTIFASGCSSWYLDSAGLPSTWHWSYDAFGEAMKSPQFEKFSFGDA